MKQDNENTIFSTTLAGRFLTQHSRFIAAALLLLALVGSFFITSQPAIAQSNTPTPTATATYIPCTSWDLKNDFRTGANAENPNRDSCGNLHVWTFMETLEDTIPTPDLTRHPDNYQLLNHNLNSNACGHAGLSMWAGNSDDIGSCPYTPFIGYNAGSDVFPNDPVRSWPNGKLLMYPGSSRLAVVRWRSPVTGYISISGGVTDYDWQGRDGIVWYLDKNTTNLASGFLKNGQLNYQAFSDGWGGSTLNAVHVNFDDDIYLVINPNPDFEFDMTGVELSINLLSSTPTPTLTPTASRTPYPCATWNLESDFRSGTNAENPNRDGCNNLNVWSFRRSANLTAAPTYELITEYNGQAFMQSGFNTWGHGNYYETPSPLIGINDSGTAVATGFWPSKALPTESGISIASSPDKMIVIAWKSPTTGTIRITGSLADRNETCGNTTGFGWYINKNATNLAYGDYDNGDSQNFTAGTGGSTLEAVSVNTNDMIYLLLRPSDLSTDYICDLAAVHLNISLPLAKSIVAGGSGTCIVNINNGVQCWGSNYYGNLGYGRPDGYLNDEKAPVDNVIGLSSGVSAVAMGSQHACALLTGGTVKCWGDNSYGQLGDGTLLSRNMPVDVSGLSGVSAIAVGQYHTCALVSGAVKCWGRNYYGQLGDNSNTDSTAPVTVRNSSNTGDLSGVSAITTGYQHTCALISGAVQCWGQNGHGELGDGSWPAQFSSIPVAVSGLSSGVSTISGGNAYTCAALTANGAKCWGKNDIGQLGDNSNTQRNTPVSVSGLTSTLISDIKAGYMSTCALISTSGGVKCWGYNSDGQVGDGTSSTRYTPVDVNNLDSGVGAIAVGNHACALLTPSGLVRCWGPNSSGQLGDGSINQRATPVDVVWPARTPTITLTPTATYTPPATPYATDVAAGYQHTCGLTPFGGVQCWGSNSDGQLGGMSYTSIVKTQSSHNCAITTYGAAKCWGDNPFGQLGNNSTTGSSTPVDVSGLSSNVTNISAGGDHSCAVISGGVQCWGRNDSGQLGNGSTTHSSTPVSVSGLSSNVTKITTGGDYSCALINDGTVKCWGDNSYGKLGNGSTTDSSTPVSVSGLTSVSGISAGSAHTCAWLTNGTIKCWGYNGHGELGNDTTIHQNVPVSVSGISSGTTAVATGVSHTCAIVSAGVKCWGGNYYGQLGDGSTVTNRNTPVSTSNLSSGVSTISAGSYHTCAVLTNGGIVRCWGYNNQGQLGITSTSPYIHPLPRDVNVTWPTPANTITPSATPTATKTPTITPTPTKTSVVVTLTSIAAEDGWVLESTETSSVGGSKDSTDDFLFVGDDAGNKQYRGILSFNTEDLPENAIIQNVQLHIKYGGVVGTNFLVSTYNLRIDMVKPRFSTGAALQNADFEDAPIATPPADPTYADSAVIVSTGTTPDGSNWYNISMNNDTVKDLINLIGKIQFRLRFGTGDNNSNTADYLKLYSGDSTYVPELIITYTTP